MIISDNKRHNRECTFQAIRVMKNMYSTTSDGNNMSIMAPLWLQLTELTHPGGYVVLRDGSVVQDLFFVVSMVSRILSVNKRACSVLSIHLQKLFSPLCRVKEHTRPRPGAEVRPCGKHTWVSSLAHQTNRDYVSMLMYRCNWEKTNRTDYRLIAMYRTFRFLFFLVLSSGFSFVHLKKSSFVLPQIRALKSEQNNLNS